MKAETRKTIQIVLAIAIIVAGVRLALIYRTRHTAAPAPKTTTPLPADYYVVPKKLHAYDLQSARELTQRPVWVREGYRFTYYPYDPRARHADFAHPAGTLGPIEKLDITDVVLDRAPRPALQRGEVRANPHERQVMAVFAKDGRQFAFPIGVENSGDFRIEADDMLYIQDPHELYKHWPADVWQAVDRHEPKPGMNELQVIFAIGYGVLQRGTEDRTLVYPNGGHPLQIVFRDGRAADIKPAAAPPA